MRTHPEIPQFDLRPWLSRLHYSLVAGTFLLAVLHLFLLRKADPRVLALFLMPPAFAWASLRSPDSLVSSRKLAWSFLTILALGDIIAHLNWLLPGMNEFPDLPRTSSRVLSWYVIVYLLYLMTIFPPILFIRPLIQRHRGQQPYFSRFTCYLGLITWLPIGPAMVALLWTAIISKWL